MRSPSATRCSRGKSPVICSEPREATASVDDAGRDDRSGRATADAPSTRAAAVRHRCFVRLEWSRRHHRPEHEPAAAPRQQQVAVLAVPAETGAVGRLPVDEGVVVHENTRVPADLAQAIRDHGKTAPEGGVVIFPGVGRDTAARPSVAGVTRAARICACADDDRPCPPQRTVRIRRSVGVAVCELHASVQTGRRGGRADARACRRTARPAQCPRHRGRRRARAASAQRRRRARGTVSPGPPLTPSVFGDGVLAPARPSGAIAGLAPRRRPPPPRPLRHDCRET